MGSVQECPSWRTRRTGHTTRMHDAADVALVHCPSCDDKAVVHWHEDGLRLGCPECGHSQTQNWPQRHFEWRQGPSWRPNADQPPCGAALWLETECCGGNRLWALNESHLDYLADYVAETQREREFPSPPGDRQLAYKLPKWMKLAKHRDEILRAIDRLRTTL
jgi:Zn ribbon nucleic-acid-binding protein